MMQLFKKKCSCLIISQRSGILVSESHLHLEMLSDKTVPTSHPTSYTWDTWNLLGKTKSESVSQTRGWQHSSGVNLLPVNDEYMYTNNFTIAFNT